MATTKNPNFMTSTAHVTQKISEIDGNQGNQSTNRGNTPEMCRSRSTGVDSGRS